MPKMKTQTLGAAAPIANPPSPQVENGGEPPENSARLDAESQHID
jgi:hypothetical protein